MTFIDRSGRTSTEYRQLFWDERERCEELEAELKRMKGINKENGDHAAELQVQLDNHRAQTDHWLTMLDKAEAQLESIYDRFVDGNCTETYINIAPLIKAAIKGRNRGVFYDPHEYRQLFWDEQERCEKLEKQLEAVLSVVDKAMLNEHVRRLLKAAIGEDKDA